METSWSGFLKRERCLVVACKLVRIELIQKLGHSRQMLLCETWGCQDVCFGVARVWVVDEGGRFGT